MSDFDSDSFDLDVLAEDLHGRTPRFSKKSHRKGDRNRPTAGEVLADLSLDKCMEEPVRSRLANERIRAMIIEVPDGGWVKAVLDSVDNFVETPIHTISRPTIPNPRERNDARLPERLSSGCTVVGASPDPERALPELLLSVADARVTVMPPDATMVMEVIRRCQGGRVPARAANLKAELLSFEEITSIIVTDGKPSESVDRLEAAIARKLKIGGNKCLPKLEDAIEYGAAREWALNLRDDLADVRKGAIGIDQVDRGAVLFGPPGTGKTLLAQMIGEACGLPTVIASMADFFASGAGYLDSVIKAQRKVFDEAKAKSPCILFLDEINAMPNVDTISSRGKDWWMPVILDFYQLLDGAMSERDGVIVIGATNRIEDINPALLRPGRLERAIHVGPPDTAGIERIMRHHLAGELAEADLGTMAMFNSSRQATGAIVMEQLRAARRVSRRAGRPLRLVDLESQIVADDTRDGDELHRAAVHEAGHVIAGLLRGTGELLSVNIIHLNGAGGATHFKERADFFRTRIGYEDHVIMLLAGRAAEEILLGEPSQGAGGTIYSDLGRATKIVAGMFASVGLGDSLLFRAPAESTLDLMTIDRDLAAKVENTLADLYGQTVALLQLHRTILLAVVQSLVEKRFLTGADVNSILATGRSHAPPE